MVRQPIEIILEILFYIVTSSIEHVITVIKLLIELFYSLVLQAQSSIWGLFISILIGSLFFLFVWKFLFKETTSVLHVILVYGAFIISLIVIILLLSAAI
jgi:hypothetical protein